MPFSASLVCIFWPPKGPSTTASASLALANMNRKSQTSKSLPGGARMPEFSSTNSMVPPCADTLGASPPGAPPGKMLTLSLPPLLAATISANFSAPVDETLRLRG